MRNRSQRNNGKVGVTGEIEQPVRGVNKRLLEHIRGVDPSLQPAIQPQPHHLLEAAAVPVEHCRERGLVAPADPAYQLVFAGFMIQHVPTPCRSKCGGRLRIHRDLKK